MIVSTRLVRVAGVRNLNSCHCETHEVDGVDVPDRQNWAARSFDGVG
jgi:hypothetical protein